MPTRLAMIADFQEARRYVVWQSGTMEMGLLRKIEFSLRLTALTSVPWVLQTLRHRTGRAQHIVVSVPAEVLEA